jgi:hypothetical protein
MRSTATTSFLLLLFALLCFAQCKKEQKAPLEQLPPETQTGANTFGCLVNGIVFKPGGAQLSGGSLQANYQNLGNIPGGGYHLRIAAISRYSNGNESKSIGLFTDSLQIVEGGEYILSDTEGPAFALYGYYKVTPPVVYDFETTFLYSGKLKISKFDPINQIVSGTFSFKAAKSNGDTINITDGRFDVRYTR